MKPDKLVTLYFSPTGTSRRIAEAIAGGIRTAEEPAPRCCDITFGAAPATELDADALLVVSVPVYGGHPAPLALERMAALRGHDTPAVAVVLFAVRLSGARWGLVLGLVLGGAVGNLIDRLLNPPAFGRGQVTDFLAYGDLFVGNVADVVVVLGVGLVCLNLFRSTPRTTADSERTDSPS